jgi:hypothetical protein
MTARVWICQCLCPSRHCIMAAVDVCETASQAEETLGASLREAVAAAMRSGVINPRCGLCGARPDGFRYETARTVFRTMAEAIPKLKALERTQLDVAAVFGDMRRYDA